MDFFSKRLSLAQNAVSDDQALFINKQEEVFYFTGFTGEDSFLVIAKSMVYFITDARFVEQAKIESKIGFNLVELKTGTDLTRVLVKIVNEQNIKCLLCCKKEIDIDFYEKLVESFAMQNSGGKLTVQNSNIVKNLRMRKDEYEIEILRQNIIITELGYHYIVRLIEEGKKESDIAAELEYYLRKNGSDKPSFDTIVASGTRSTLPHGRAGEKLISENEVIVLDFGIMKNGYCSDFTRSYYFGKIIIPKIREIHSVVLEALKTAENAVKPGIRANEVHKAAYDVIKRAGYEKYFLHSTGHGVGLEIHELPRISFTDDTVLEEGMVFTVEPGIYVPDIGGIRLEDMVAVGKNGCEVLTQCSYDL